MPISFGAGRVVIGGDAAATTAPVDSGYFNYSDYDQSTLRGLRIGVSASVRVTTRLSFLGEVRTQNFDRVWPFALYARIRPLRSRRLDIQVGRIPPTFGTYTRRAYSNQNPLIGSPLAYQYLTSLRPDAVPATADELLLQRGRGWLTRYSIGNPSPARGVPLVTAFTWDTGVQVVSGWRAVDLAAAVTTGTVSNPRVGDDNRGKQFAARIAVTPTVGLVVGASFARGQFLTQHVIDQLPHKTSGVQQAVGMDVEFSKGHLVSRADAVLSTWQLPLQQEPLAHGRLKAVALSLEARYTFWPGLYGAIRAESLSFNRIAGSAETMAWDAPVSRVEIGGGYYLRRNLVARVSWQDNRRDGGRVTRQRLPAAQLLYWF